MVTFVIIWGQNHETPYLFYFFQWSGTFSWQLTLLTHCFLAFQSHRQPWYNYVKWGAVVSIQIAITGDATLIHNASTYWRFQTHRVWRHVFCNNCEIEVIIIFFLGRATHLATLTFVNIGSGNDLLPDGTKTLPEPMLTYYLPIEITKCVIKTNLVYPNKFSRLRKALSIKMSPY